MKQTKCYTCEKVTHNLLTPNCGHKICFNCVKNNKNTHKCSYCSVSLSKNKLNSLSPARRLVQNRQRDKSAKTKSIQSHRHDDRHNRPQQGSPFILRSSRKSQMHIQSCSNYGVQNSINQDASSLQTVNLLCKQHHQPLTLFSKSSKQAICSVCLCSKSKYKQQILPIKGAQEYIKRQNQAQRQQSRIILNDVETSFKVIGQNKQQFQKYYSSHVKVISEIFSNLHKQLQDKQNQLRLKIDQLFLKKLKECQQIQNDLSYLIETLRSYREENRENNSLTQSLYVYSSFKVIKSTMKTLNLQYISYQNKNVNLLEYRKDKFDSMLVSLLNLHEQLPLKKQDHFRQSNKRNLSASSQHRISHNQSASGYSHKKQSIYENLLNGKHHLFKQNQPSHLAKSQMKRLNIGNPNQKLYEQNQTKSASKSHNNSLSTYAQQHQKPKHNGSTSSYFNHELMVRHNKEQQLLQNQSKRNHKKSSLLNVGTGPDVFDYELKTPIKNLMNNRTENNEYKEDSKALSYFDVNNKRKIGSVSSKKNNSNMAVSTHAISGSDMSEEQRSLYKRLLKSRFTKNPYNQQEKTIQTKQNKIDNVYQQKEQLVANTEQFNG